MAGSSSLKGNGTQFNGSASFTTPGATLKPAGTSFDLTSFGRAGPADVIRMPASHTVVEEEVGGRAGGQLASLAGRIGAMGSVFDEESKARVQQRELMNGLHFDQVTRLDEVAEEVDEEMTKLAEYVADFKKKTMQLSQDTFDELNGDLTECFGKLGPRLASLEARSKTLRAGLEQEKADRVRETEALLAPLREKIVVLRADLEQERKIRVNREAELKAQLKQYVGALDEALDVELEHRKRRHEGAVGDIQQDQQRLQKRQEETVEKSRCKFADELEKELDAERDARIGGQDTMAKTLTEFIQAFHADIKERASVV